MLSANVRSVCLLTDYDLYSNMLVHLYWVILFLWFHTLTHVLQVIWLRGLNPRGEGTF